MTAALVPVAVPVVVGEVVKSVTGVIDTAVRADAAIQMAREQTRQCELQSRVMLAQIASDERRHADEQHTQRHLVEHITTLGLAGKIPADQMVELMLGTINRQR
jgi:hypothetical protein